MTKQQAYRKIAKALKGLEGVNMSVMNNTYDLSGLGQTFIQAVNDSDLSEEKGKKVKMVSLKISEELYYKVILGLAMADDFVTHLENNSDIKDVLNGFGYNKKEQDTINNTRFSYVVRDMNRNREDYTETV